MGTELIATVTHFDFYSVHHNKELSTMLKKPYWLTNENYCFFLGSKYSRRWVVVPKGYGTDGASVPEIFQNLVAVFGIHGAAVILHDWLCEYGYVWCMLPDGEVIKEFLTREQIDHTFFEALKVVKFPAGDQAKIEIAINAYRVATNPKVPNVNYDKQRFEVNNRVRQGWTEPDGARLYEYLGVTPLEVA